jgi:hypothetical protein
MTTGGVQVVFNGSPLGGACTTESKPPNCFPASLMFVSSTQINFQVPWELEGPIDAPACGGACGAYSQYLWFDFFVFVQDELFVPNICINCVLDCPNRTGPCGLRVFFALPAVFQMNAQHEGAILDTNYNLVSSTNPTSPDAVVQIYCTGLGPVSVPQQDGVAAPLSPLAVSTSGVLATIGGVPATVEWAGLTPSSVGLYQVNVVVPNVPAGFLPVILSANGISSTPVYMQVN